MGAIDPLLCNLTEPKIGAIRLSSWLIGGVEKCPNLDLFAIISQTLLARIMKPFAL
jgi:hypothetical protein